MSAFDARDFIRQNLWDLARLFDVMSAEEIMNAICDEEERWRYQLEKAKRPANLTPSPTPVSRMPTIFKVDLDGKIISVCKTAVNLRGRGRAGVRGKKITTVPTFTEGGGTVTTYTVEDVLIDGTPERATDSDLEIVCRVLFSGES